MTALLRIVAALALGFACEILSVFWFRHAQRGNPRAVAAIGATVALLHATGVSAYVFHGYLIPAYAFGVGMGAYVGMRISQKRAAP